MGQKVVLKPLSPIERGEKKNEMKTKKIKEKEKEKNEKSKRVRENKAIKVDSGLLQKVRKIRESTKSGKSKNEDKRKESLLVSHKEVKMVLLAKREPLFFMPTNMLLNAYSPLISLPIGFGALLEEFNDVFPKEMPHVLPPLRCIKHYIELTLGGTLPNRVAYRMNLKESKEIQKKLASWLRESMSPCAIPMIFVPKKDGT
ncbi:hypothetical protein CR513_11121, partial [Mucuna pruriens]